MITPAFNLTATSQVLPKLAIDFTTGSLDSRITFTRTTSGSNPATYVGSNGFITTATNNQPRFDYDSVTSVCKGLLIEESRENLLLQSENFSTTWSVFGGAVATQTETSPAGGASSFKFTEDSSTTNHLVSQQVSYASNNTVTFSIYVKASGRSSLTIDMSDNSTGQCSGTFDLTTAATTSSDGGSWSNVSAKATLEKNGWVRCSLTATKNAGTSIICRFGPSPLFYAGNGTSGVFVYGAQLETGAFATSYIPTTTTSLTRNTDVVTMTGANFSDWFNASEGAFDCTFIPFGNEDAPSVLVVDNGTAQNMMRLYTIPSATTTRLALNIRTNNVVQRDDFIDTAGSALNVVTGASFAYKDAAFVGAKNGGAPEELPSGNVPTVDQLKIGRSAAAGSEISAWFQKIAYYPQRLTSREVQAFSK